MSVRKRVYRNHFPFFYIMVYYYYYFLALIINIYKKVHMINVCFFFLHNYTINCELKVLMID